MANNDYGSDERTTHIFFLCFSAILVVVLFLSRILEDSPRLRTYISEPAMILLVGTFCSLIVRLIDQAEFEGDDMDNDIYDDQYDESEYTSSRSLPKIFLLFPSKVFFLALLPPILFNSGYQLQRELFYRHLSPIALFSVGGTALSAFGAGGFLWLLSSKGWLGDAFEPTPLELLTFGALIAATDTVSVVGVLQRKRVDPHLFNLVFGESALNDAVALVLFKTLANFLRQNAANDANDEDGQTDVYKKVGKYLLDLLVQCAVSPILGLIFASLMGLAFKHGKMADHMMLELSLYILPVYIPFMFAELLELSGMITIFFTGIFARRYMEPNVSEETREYARILFNLLAFLAEVCIFLELGLSVCGIQKGHFSWPFVSWAFVAALLGRAIGVYPVSFLYNLSLTRPILDPTTAATIAVEMMAMGKSDTFDGLDASENDTKAHDYRIHDENMIEKSETPPVAQTTKLKHSATENDTEGESENINKYFEGTDNVLPSSERECDNSIAGDSTFSLSSTDMSVLSTSYYNMMPNVVSKRETPERKRDKVIPTKFMHLLWFAGLRGAVAYACAREFPDVYGHRNEFINATMVIVIITIVLMGGATEPLMDRLGIRTNVDNEEYMRAWHQQRKLKGRFLHFEYNWIYRFVVQDESIRLMGESCGYIEQVDDRAVFGFFSGKDFGAKLKTRRQDKRRKSRRMKRHSFKGLRRRHPSQKEESSYDSSVFKKEYSRKKSLLDSREDEDHPGATNANSNGDGQSANEDNPAALVV